MASESRAPPPADGGVRITPTGKRSTVAPGLVLLGLAGWLVLRLLRSDPAPADPVSPPPRPPAPPAGAPAGTPPAASPAQPRPDVAAASAAPHDPAAIADARQRREERRVERHERAQPRYTPNPPGEHAGIDAFPPPGTKPIKRGIVVPDDFELPEGYVRHYQTTDDGRRLPPILMFHPDAVGVDENGNPLLGAEDRVVPPDMAPPGLPHRMLDEATDVDDSVARPVHPDPGPSTRRR